MQIKDHFLTINITMEKDQIILNFENPVQKQDFLSWFLDSGGECSYHDYLEAHDKEILVALPESKECGWDFIEFAT